MGYCLEYQKGSRTDPLRGRRYKIAWMTVLWVLIFVFLVNLFWPEGAAVLENFLFPESAAVAAAAMEEMAADLEEGIPLRSAVEMFLDKLERK